MNEFVINNEMERLIKAKENQPEEFAQLPATMKMAGGIYQNAKQQAEKQPMSAEDKLRLNGLKQQIARDILSPHERTILALEISELEKKIND